MTSLKLGKAIMSVRFKYFVSLQESISFTRVAFSCRKITKQEFQILSNLYALEDALKTREFFVNIGINMIIKLPLCLGLIH